MGKADGQSQETGYTPPGELGSDACRQDACCVWSYVVQDMVAQFRGPSGRCTASARGAVRLGFHDAAAWAKGMPMGGADGSMILTDEVTRADNKGLEEIVDLEKQWLAKYQQFGAGAADLVSPHFVESIKLNEIDPNGS